MRQRLEKKHSDFSLPHLQSPASAWLKPAGSSWCVVKSLRNTSWRGHLLAGQSRAAGKFLVLFSFPSLSSFFIFLYILYFIAALYCYSFASLTEKSHEFSFPSSYTVFMDILYFYFLLLHFWGVTTFCSCFSVLLLLLTFLNILLHSLHHAQVTQGFWVARKSLTQDTE